ncbi:terminase large subunit [Sinorhizobium medicae]|nr:terminase large subunit [Sinorhizobium medicae]MDX0498980.1 terminase large subunit [Sinorhizobium medicae]MDX0530711.1 terminase large subunit [Sinorhizobium medicae]MDX1206775.1 terminase large subunit [Sinorhizobium medicae]
MNWTTACPDWEKRIVSQRSLIPFRPLFPSEADYALSVFKALKVTDLPGQPTFGEVSDQWVFDFVSAIFGAYDAETGKQLITEFFLLISKKNTKSTIAAAIMLTALIINWRHNEELLILAPTIEVAQNSYKPAAAMVRADPELDANADEGGLLVVQDHLRTIKHLGTDAALKVVAADTDTVSGKKAGRILIDELWVFGKRPNADAMLREATGGLVSRPEGFVITLSTQSDEPPAGVFKAKLDYARAVRDGQIENRKFLPVIYEFPPEMIKAKAYEDSSNFYVTNPNLGRSVSQEWLQDEMTKELSGDRTTLATFLAKHLNVEIGMNLRSNRWPGADLWDGRADQAITVEYLIDNCDVIVPGLDGGGLDDLFGLVLVGRHKKTRDWLVWCHAWCHRGVPQRRKSIASKLQDFATARELTIVDDKLEDISEIVSIIAQIKDADLLACVAVDPAGLGEMVEALDEIGVTQEEGMLVGVPQGFQLMNAIKTAERKLANGTLRHSNTGLMQWCVGNLKIEPTATAIRATKQNAGDAKVDVAMALFNAVTVMSRNPEPKRKPQYQMLVVGR